MNSRLKAWGLLVILVSITLVPLFLARYVFHHTTTLNLNKKNHGEIMAPKSVEGVRVLQGSKLKPLSAQVGKWSIVYDSAGSCCDKACLTQVYGLHQLRIALHNGIERTRVALLMPKRCRVPRLDSSVAVWRFSAAEQKKWQQQAGAGDEQILILDPNLMTVMKYPKNSKPNPVYEDMRVLLHTSQIG